MWKAWLAQTDGSVVVEAMDASQDARLRLIVASLILLFGIAFTLVIVALSRGRKKNVSGAREPAVGSQSSQQKPAAAPNTGSKAIPAAASSRPVTAPQPRPAANSEAPESLASDESASAAQVPPPPAKAAARATNPMTATTRPPLTSEKVNPANAHAPLPSSPAPATPPKSPLSTFDPQEYKKTLARMDPEKKRQEILQRLAEIQKDTKNAEARAAVRLPSVTAAQSSSKPVRLPADTPVNTPPFSTTDSASAQSFAKPEAPLSKKESLWPVAAAKISEEDTFIAPKESEANPLAAVSSSSEMATHAPPATHAEHSREKHSKGEEDFSRLSSIQNKFARQSQRKALSEWLREIEGEVNQ